MQQRLNQRLWGLFIELIQIIESLLVNSDEQELLERIFHNDQAYERIARLLGAESAEDAA